MEHEKPFENKANSLNRPYFKLYGDKCEIKRNVIASPNMFEKKRIQFKRKVTSKELDLKLFDKFETSLDSKNPIVYKTNVENSRNIIPTMSTKIYKLQRLYTPNECNNKAITEQNIKFFQNNNDDMEYLGTAEIEEVLNDIKQREIQMIADQEPSVTNIITNAVTETSFDSMPYTAQSNIFPSYAFSTFLFVSNTNNTFTQKSIKINKRQTHHKMRSLKEDSYTMACNIEDKLQKKLKKTYCKVKAKLRKDFNKEIKESKDMINETLKKCTTKCTKGTTKCTKDTTKCTKGTTKCTSKEVCTLLRKSETKTLRKNKKIKKKPHIKGIRFYRKTTKSMENLIKGKFPIATRKIQTPELEFSSTEQFLAKTNVNSLIRNNKLSRRFSKRNCKKNCIETNNNVIFYKDGERIPEVLNYNDINKNANNRSSIDEITEKYDRFQVTADANYQALSNKISFNDYVNGYKYYLNFQKENDDDKYSNLVRYQAHKHHNVDDIGKFILKKIPRLPSKRQRRFFIESETLEDLDLSTKSEDSWFKKHFFIYTESPRKFHTSQTVSLKAPDLQINECSTGKATNVHTHKNTLPETKPIRLIRHQRENNHSYNLKLGYCVHTALESLSRRRAKPDLDISNRKKKKRSNFPIIENKKSILSQKHSQHTVCKRKVNIKKNYDEKFKTLSTISHRKNGFVNIDLVHRSTGKIKLKTNNKRKSKINLFKTIEINCRKPKPIEKSQNMNREKRHIFKKFRNFFCEKPKNEIKNEHKVFEYKIVTPNEAPEAYNNFDSIKLLNVDDIWKQIPTITEDFTYPYHSLQPEVYKNEMLYFSRKPELGLKTKSVSILSGEGISHFKNNKDDGFAVNFKTRNMNKLKPAFTVDMKTINNPTLVNMLTTDMKNSVDNVRNNMKERTAKVQSIGNMLHDYGLDYFKQSSEKKVDTINNYTQDQYNDSIEIKNKKTQLLEQNSKNTLTERYISGKKILKTTKKRKIQGLNKVTKISHTMPFPFSVSTITKGTSRSSNEFYKIHHDKIISDAKVYGGQTITPAAKNFKQTASNVDDSCTVRRSKIKGIYNNKNPKSSISSKVQVNAPPEHYFTTFLPMQINNFHKFLKEKEIDVESVTAPLINSLPRSHDPWTPKKSKSNSKIKESLHNSKNYISSKTTRESHSLDSLPSQHPNYSKYFNFYENMYGINDQNNNQYAIRSQNSQKSSNKDLQSYLSMPDKKKDPLRFSHMTTERYFSKHNNKETTRPERIHISGHSYRYDVIYHKALSNNDEWNSDGGNDPDISIIRNNNNDDIYPLIIEKEKARNINKNASPRSQRGTNESRKEQSINSKNKHKYLHKYMKQKCTTENNIRKLKHEKRNAKEESFTVKDVESVTAPLINSLPRSNDPWTPKKSKSNSKIKEGMHNSKNYISSKTTRESHSLDSLPSQHPNHSKHLNFYENMYGINDNNNNQYGATRSQNSQKSSDKDLQSYLSMPDKKIDPLRFSHMMTERYFSKYNNKETKRPERIHISGHSYRYDVIYHKAHSNNDEWNSDGGNEADISIIRNKNNDDICPPIIEKEKARNINKNAMPRRQRGTNESRKEQSLNSKNKHKSLHKSMKQKCTTENNIRKLKHEKRNAKEETFTAKDVAALEVVVDLLKNTQTNDGSDVKKNEFSDNIDHKSVHPLLTSLKERHVTNSIQVHIAIPYDTDDKKRSLDPIRLRKVFSAVMSTPVDLEYQIHSFEETTKTPTSIVQEVLTPGLYLLVENTNLTYPLGNFVLKPIKNSSESSKLAVRYVTTTENQKNSPSSFNVERLSFNKDFIYAVNKVIQMNENPEFNKTNSKKKRSVSAENNKIINANSCSLLEEKRHINWDVIKKYFSHDKLCNCHCKANQTMCRECVACNAVISELMFELENLAKYMTQHCTEIQTFFWKNPSGGRKLRDVIHRIDTLLSDYYKRVKGKCKGRTCQMLSSSIDKRSSNYLCNDNLVNRLNGIADDLENALKHNIFNDKILISVTKLLNKAKGCMRKRLNKRSGSNAITKQPLDKNIYSLSNIKVNLICNKKITKPDFVTTNTINKNDFEKNIHSLLYYDDEEIKTKKKNEKAFKAFLKKCSLKKKNRTKKLNENNYNFIRNMRAIDLIHNFKQVNNDELNRYYTVTDSVNYNINDLLKLITNVDSLEALTSTKSFGILNQTITKKPLRGIEMKNKIACTLSTSKMKNDLNLNSKNSLYKINHATIPATKSSRSTSNKSRTKCLNTVTKSKFLNILKSLEFLPKKYQVKNRMTTADNRYVRSRISKFKKHQSKTKKVKNNISYNDNNRNISTDVISSVLVIDDDDDNNRFSDESSTIRNSLNKCHSKNSSPKFTLSSLVSNSVQDERAKSGFKGFSENSIKDTNFESTNHTFHCGSGIHKTPTFKNYTDRHKNVLQKLKNVHNKIFNYTDYSYEPKTYKGLLNKIADQFVIKILSDSEFKKENQKCHNCMHTAAMKQKDENKYFEKKHEQSSSVNVKHERKLASISTVPTPTTVKMTIQEINKKEKAEGKDVQNNSEDLKEADDRNKVCDIASTISHVIRMYNNMSKTNFEQYVRSISCHKYKNIPNYISIKYKNGVKKRAKYRRRCKTSKKDNENQVLKWDWIRDKRSLIVDDIKVELDDYEDSEKSNNIELNMTARDDIIDRIDKKLNKSIEITFANTQNGQNNKKYFYGNLHQVGKRSLLSYTTTNQMDLQLLNTAGFDKKEQYFEFFFKRKDGTYQESFDRRKRSDFDKISDLRRDLQNLPPLRPLSDEIFVTMGDSVSLSCLQPSNGPNQSVSNYVWNTERNEMLNHKNIVVNGSQLFLTDVDTKNFGTYVCSKNNAVIRSIKVTITSNPRFNIVFTPVYQIDSACTYKDLKAIQQLNSAISRDSCGKYCSVRIDEPICLRDRKDNYLSYIRPIVVISLNSIPNINCSPECKRNLKCSLVRLLISNMPSLAFVKVLISFDGMTLNKTLTPSIGSKRRSFVTHTLRRKDANGHYEYHKIAADMEPGNFNLVLLCPGGFYLLNEQKICVVCPSNTFSKEGDNVCRICSPGARAAPGSRSCHLPHLRSWRLALNANEWSIATFCALVFSAFAICYGAIHLLRRACRSQGNNTWENSSGNSRLCRSETCQKTPRIRPLSPSHVILSRLLRSSLTRATDSQENRFELWKEKNTLPPLPPIDFDL